MKNSHTALLSTAIVLVSAVAGILISVNRNSAADVDAVTTTAATEPSTAVTEPSAAPPASVSLSPHTLTLGAGEAFTPTAAYDGTRPAADASFAADRANILNVDASTGKMTAASEGYANVTMTSNNGLTDICCVTVKKAPSGVQFPNQSVMMQKGETGVLHAEPVSDSEGFSGAVFQSEDPDIVDVSESGEITAKAPGTAAVTASVYNGKTAALSVTVLDNSGFTDQTTVCDSELLQDAGWKYPAVTSVPAGTAVQQYGTSADGRWRKVKCGDSYGWMYNKAFGDTKNYSEYSVATLPVMADDLLFDIGTDKRGIFDYVYDISYDTNGDDTTENLCVQYFERMRGSCYHHAAMLCYLYNRCGYETVRLVGISAYDGESEHSWCMSKTDDGWRHVDAQKFTIRTADEQYFVEDYSQYFNWNRDAFPVVTIPHTNSDAPAGTPAQTDTTTQPEP